MPSTNATVAAKLDDVPLKTLKAALAPALSPDASVNQIDDVGALIVAALDAAQLSQKEAAITMGISEPQFTNQLQGKGHLSLKRLWLLPDDFWRELLVLVVERKRVARVRRQLVMVMR